MISHIYMCIHTYRHIYTYDFFHNGFPHLCRKCHIISLKYYKTGFKLLTLMSVIGHNWMALLLFKNAWLPSPDLYTTILLYPRLLKSLAPVSLSSTNIPIILLTYWLSSVLGLHWCARVFLICEVWGLLFSCSAQASHCSDFSCCGAQTVRRVGLSSCGSQTLEHRLSICGT